MTHDDYIQQSEDDTPPLKTTPYFHFRKFVVYGAVFFFFLVLVVLVALLAISPSIFRSPPPSLAPEKQSAKLVVDRSSSTALSGHFTSPVRHFSSSNGKGSDITDNNVIIYFSSDLETGMLSITDANETQGFTLFQVETASAIYLHDIDQWYISDRKNLFQMNQPLDNFSSSSSSSSNFLLHFPVGNLNTNPNFTRATDEAGILEEDHPMLQFAQHPFYCYLPLLSITLYNEGYTTSLSPPSLLIHGTAYSIFKMASSSSTCSFLQEELKQEESKDDKGSKSTSTSSQQPLNVSQKSNKIRSQDCTSNPYEKCNNKCYGRCGEGCSCWKYVCGDCLCHRGCEAHDYYCSCVSMKHFKCVSFNAYFVPNPCGCCAK